MPKRGWLEKKEQEEPGFTARWKAKISAANRVRMNEPEIKEKCRVGWGNIGTPEAQAKANKSRMEPEARKRRSEISYRVSMESWSDPKKRVRMLAGVRSMRTSPNSYANSPETRAKAMKTRGSKPPMRQLTSEGAIERWADPGFRARSTVWLAEMNAKPERQEQLRHSIALMHSPEIRAKTKATMADPEFRKRRSEISVANWQDPEYRAALLSSFAKMRADPGYAEKMLAAMAKVAKSDTRPERIVASILGARCVTYSKQVPVGGTLCDFFVPPSTYIFVDGCFWHGCPEHGSPKGYKGLAKVQSRDERTREWFRGHPERSLVRIWEHDVEEGSVETLLGGPR
jgi:DNA mismatch endonuclease, patch repair protein